MPLATHDMLVPCLGMGLGTNGGGAEIDRKSTRLNSSHRR